MAPGGCRPVAGGGPQQFQHYRVATRKGSGERKRNWDLSLLCYPMYKLTKVDWCKMLGGKTGIGEGLCSCCLPATHGFVGGGKCWGTKRG